MSARAAMILGLATLAAVGVGAMALVVTRTTRQSAADRGVVVLRGEADTLIKAKQFAQAADTLEGLQMLLMKARRYQEALDVSFEIDEAASRASDRRSPWHYVRIGEVYRAMGRDDQYFDWVEKAIRERSFSRLQYFQASELDGVRNHPRFKQLEAAAAAIVGVGRQAKDFEVTLIDGSTFRLSAQLGRVVVVDFWDVRCGPCRKEMPNLKAIHRDFGNKGLEILGISLDTEKPLLDGYLKQEALPWKIACSWAGWDDPTAKLYQISATPSTWVIDRRGVVRYCDVKGEGLRKAVERLLAES
jgi:peroxiredoxin